MIARYNSISLKLGVPGILLQIAGVVLGGNPDQAAQAGNPGATAITGPLLILAGTALLIAGLAFYAKAKGQHPAWCLMGFLSIIGLVVLGVLRDNYPSGEPRQ